MAAIVAANLSINYGWALGEDGWNTGMDSNLKKLDALVFLNVISATTTAPPGSPTNGDRYIIPTGATGAWSANVGKVAVWEVSAWVYYTAKRGWVARSAGSKQLWEHDGTGWKLPGAIYTAYADDAAAATGGVAIGGVYIKTSTAALTVRIA